MDMLKEEINIINASGVRQQLQIATIKGIQPYMHLNTHSNGRQVLPTGEVVYSVRLTTREGDTIDVPRGVADNDKELLDLCLAILCPSPLKNFAN